MQCKTIQYKAALEKWIRKALSTSHNNIYWPLLENPSLSVHFHLIW